MALRRVCDMRTTPIVRTAGPPPYAREMRQIGSDSALARAGRVCTPTVRYWMETEVHVYGFSIAANVLLSFFPFLIVMVSFCKYVFQWPGAVDAIMLALND